MKKRHRNQNVKYNNPTVKPILPCYYSTQYEFLQLDTSDLQSNQKYQRPVDPKHVQDIVNNFDPLYLDEILVSFRDGRYYVIDGQNRIAAFKHKNGGRDCIVHCKVYHGLTYEQEAEMFHHLDSIKKKLRYCDAVRAKAESKNDPTIIDINRILNMYRISWHYTGTGSHKDYTFTCSEILIDRYDDLGPVMFEQMIRLLVYTWEGARESLTAAFIKGMSLFVKKYAKDGNEEFFIRKVGALSPAEIKARVLAEGSAISTELKYARVFLNRYNHRAGAEKLPYRLE